MKFKVDYKETVFYSNVVEFPDEEVERIKVDFKEYYDRNNIKKIHPDFEEYFFENIFHFMDFFQFLNFTIVGRDNFDYNVEIIE